MKSKSLIMFVVLLLTLPFAVAACGGGDDSTSSTGTSSATGGESTGGEGGGELVEGPPETPPTTINQGLDPLPEAPPKGVKVAYLQCDIPACKSTADVFKEIAGELKWDLSTIVFKTGQPQDAMTQALNIQGLEYIVNVGPSTLIEPQLKVAAEKGVKLIKGGDPSEPEPPTVPTAIGSTGGQILPAEAYARWVINDSEGKAKVAFIGFPEAPTTAAGAKAFQSVLEEECPECQFDEVPVTGEELGAGTVPAKVVAFVQSHPDDDYVIGAFGNLMLGVGPALKNAGQLERLKLGSYTNMEAAELEALRSGEFASFLVADPGESAYVYSDAIIRLAMDLPLPQEAYNSSPQFWLCKPDTADQCEEWLLLPEEFRTQYEELWQLP